jgi:hypothetical protein
MLMALGVLWFTHVPSTSQPWMFRPDATGSIVPPVSYVTHFLPGYVVFGIGLSIMVAPLTTALMTSVPVRHSGLASAINNAISRVGPQLVGAIIFMAITASFYAGLATRVPGLGVASAEVRSRIAPLNPPAAGVPIDQAAAAREASTEAYHLAMYISALLLAAGAVINAAGIGPGRPGGPAGAGR